MLCQTPCNLLRASFCQQAATGGHSRADPPQAQQPTWQLAMDRRAAFLPPSLILFPEQWGQTRLPGRMSSMKAFRVPPDLLYTSTTHSLLPRNSHGDPPPPNIPSTKQQDGKELGGEPEDQHSTPVPDLSAAHSHCWFIPKLSHPTRGLGHPAPWDTTGHRPGATLREQHQHCRFPPAATPWPRSTHHLVEGVAQQPVLVEDEEPALPFLQEKTVKAVMAVPAHKAGVTTQDIPQQSSSMMQSPPSPLSAWPCAPDQSPDLPGKGLSVRASLFAAQSKNWLSRLKFERGKKKKKYHRFIAPVQQFLSCFSQPFRQSPRCSGTAKPLRFQ